MLIGNKKYSKTLLFWIEKSQNIFQTIKEALAKAINLVPPCSRCNYLINNGCIWFRNQRSFRSNHQSWKLPLRFFYRNLTPIERKFSAYDREMFCICTAIKQFKHAFKERSFTIFTDEKTLFIAFKQNWTKLRQDNLDTSVSLHCATFHPWIYLKKTCCGILINNIRPYTQTFITRLRFQQSTASTILALDPQSSSHPNI